MFSWILCAVFGSAAVFFGVRLYLVRKSLTDICRDLGGIIKEDTNALISVSTGISS